MPTTAIPLGQRFPAAHQFLRMCLLDEIFPIAASVSCVAEETEAGRWLVCLRWPELHVAANGEFSGEELRRVYGPWSSWVRSQALDIAGLLPI
jgi:hypothetical protein